MAPISAPPPPPSTVSPQSMQRVASKVARRFTYPAESPFVSITLYYVLLFAAALAFYNWVPGAAHAFNGERLSEMASTGPLVVNSSEAIVTGAFSVQFALLLGVAMIGAFLLMVPPSWVYMATRSKKGFDQSVVQTMLILALTVAGVIVIVRNSIALAFSLAGIVGAVRYRNNLPETRDTLFIFLSIGVGLAAGVDALPAAAALSVVFCYMVLIVTRMDYGMCELGKPSTHLLHSAPPPLATVRTGIANGKKPKKPRGDFNAVLVVRAMGADPARRVVEPFLARETKRWQLAEVETNAGSDRAHLKYLLRLSKKRDAADLEDALLEIGPPLIGARIH